MVGTSSHTQSEKRLIESMIQKLTLSGNSQ